MRRSGLLVLVVGLLLAVACGGEELVDGDVRGGGGGGDTIVGVDQGGGGGGGDTSTPHDSGGTVDPPLPNTGCPSTDGFTLSGVVRLTGLLANPPATGTGVVVKMPCGREETDPDKQSCGTGHVHVWLCTSPDCSAAGDPVRVHLNEEGSLVQPSFDSEPFEFCGLTAGTYHVLPFIDHDESGRLSNYDWTMGVKNLGDNSVAWPARVEGHEVVMDGDVALGESLVPTNPEASPVVVNFFEYRHPGPTWQSEDAWLFLAASVDPDVATNTVGIRAIDLASHQERDFIAATPAMDARSLAQPGDTRYEGDLEKIAYFDDTAFLSTAVQGLLLTVDFGAGGEVSQGHHIDLRAAGITFGSQDFIHGGAVLEDDGKRWLVLVNRESAGKPLPHRPANPLIVVDITNLDAGDVTTGHAITDDEEPALSEVRLDRVATHGDLIFATETGANSNARRTDGLNRLWVFRLDAAGQMTDLHIFDGERYNAEGNVSECGSNPPYRMAGLWVGDIQGTTHAVVGNLRTISVWRFPGDDPAQAERVRHGEGVDAFDPRLDDHSIGYSVLRASPDGSKLFVFGDCKGRYLAVRPGDWAGAAGSRTQSRRRIAVLDLSSLDADGLPERFAAYGDRRTAPDVVRESLSGPDIALDEDIVRGIGMDCRAVLWDIYDTYGYLNVAGSTFGSDCIINRVADAVVTDHHIYVIGEGAVSFGTTGLGTASELLVLDLATGQEVLDPNWRWLYEGSAFQNRYGYFGLTIGERDNTDTVMGLFLREN